MRNEENINYGRSNMYSHARAFRNKLGASGESSQEVRDSTVDNLEASIKYFEARLAEYEKSIKGATYFLSQIKTPGASFDEVTELYWRMAFDPCSRHSKDIFLSLNPVFEALRDKFSSLELGI